MITEFKDKSNVELINLYNSLLVSRFVENISQDYLEELKREFDVRQWDYANIIDSSGKLDIEHNKDIYLRKKKIYFVNEYILGTVRGEFIMGEVTYRSQLWLDIKMVAPYINWTSRIGLPKQALGTDFHFWAEDGNKTVKKYALELLSKSYAQIRIIDDNIDEITKGAERE
jgi:hypothetical protein